MNPLDTYDALSNAIGELRVELGKSNLSHVEEEVLYAMLEGLLDARHKEYITHQREILKRKQDPDDHP